ncbi:MAG: hypothetical protein GY778_00190 [bacterium]|nr:hypothetical protein [bacterium]
MGSAYDRLDRLAQEAEAQGDIETALAALRGIRGSILATRSFYTPYKERLEPANRRIAALMAKVEMKSNTEREGVDGVAEGELIAWHYQLLDRDESPSVFWSLVAILGFALWLGGGLLFALRGVTADDKMVQRTAAYAAIMVAVGLFVWMLGLHLA